MFFLLKKTPDFGPKKIGYGFGKPLGTISAVQMDFVQIAFQPPPPQANGPFGATFFAEN